jgi:sugar/nucleoside kinase (ribokinase family)
MGSAGVDYLAQVAAFPSPDAKLRTERLEVQGGGNAGNALTAAARLGLSPALVSKIGGDALGDGILAEFGREGVGAAAVLRAAGAPSPFTYIIVDVAGGTRTCIHTPGEPFFPRELTPQLADAALEGAAAVYFDGRLTEAAALLAAAARRRGVPVLVEAERLRPGLEALLALADFVVTSAHFPGEWTGEAGVGDAVAATWARLPAARWVVTTLGSRGCVLVERAGAKLQGEAAPAVAEELIERLFAQAAAAAGGGGGAGAGASGSPVCVSASGVEIFAGGAATAAAPHRLRLRRGDAEDAGVAAAAAAAARAAAAANADAGGAERYAGSAAAAEPAVAGAAAAAWVTVAQAARLPPGAVLDTTGAGDAFIGSMLYGVATGKPVREALALGAAVAAAKCTVLGARPGLPRRGDLVPHLL